jgi:hypothetical protein
MTKEELRKLGGIPPPTLTHNKYTEALLQYLPTITIYKHGIAINGIEVLDTRMLYDKTMRFFKVPKRNN